MKRPLSTVLRAKGWGKKDMCTALGRLRFPCLHPHHYSRNSAFFFPLPVPKLPFLLPVQFQQKFMESSFESTQGLVRILPADPSDITGKQEHSIMPISVYFFTSLITPLPPSAPLSAWIQHSNHTQLLNHPCYLHSHPCPYTFFLLK